MSANYPEPPVTPPESDYFTASGCRHEVYEGAEYYVYGDDQFCSIECLKEAIIDDIKEMELWELKELFQIVKRECF